MHARSTTKQLATAVQIARRLARRRRAGQNAKKEKLAMVAFFKLCCECCSYPGVFNSRHSQTSSMRPSTKMNPIVTNSQICQTFSEYYQRRVECQGFQICKAVQGIFNFAKGTSLPRRTRRYLPRRYMPRRTRRYLLRRT